MATTLTFNPLTGNFDAVLVAAAAVQTWMKTPSSANLAAAMSDETGTAGSLVFSTAPTLTGPVTLTEAVGSSALTITGATQTASFPALNITQTWNNAAVTFTLIKANITATAVGSGSLLIDLQRGGVSQFAVDYFGGLTAANGLTHTNKFSTAQGGQTTLYSSTTNGLNFSVSAAALNAVLYGAASGVIEQRNSTNAQTFRLYNTYTDASNYERLGISATATQIIFTGEAAGTGTIRPMLFGSTSYTSNVPLQINTTLTGTQGVVTLINGGTISGSSDRVWVNVGGSYAMTAGNSRGLYIGTTFGPSSTSTAVAIPLTIAPTINYSNATPGAGSYEALKIAVTETALPTGTNYLIRASAGAAGTTEKFSVRNTGLTTWADAADLVFGTSTGTKIGTATTQKLGFYNATPIVQGASVADATGGAIIDAEARTAINALISRIEALGLIATV